VICIFFILPGEASGWGEEAHARIVTLTLKELLPTQEDLAAFESDIADGASDAELSENRWTAPLESESDIEAEIELLASIPHDKNDLSRHFAYRMGILSQAVANSALPLAANPNPQYSRLLKQFETDIEKEVNSYKVFHVSYEQKRYPLIYLNQISSKSKILEGAVKDAYTSGGGYEDCRDEVVKPSLHRAVEVVASIWLTVLSDDLVRPDIPAAIQQKYYIDQIRFSSAKGHLDDVHAALHALSARGERIPLTPTIVGEDFFDLPYGIQTGEIYGLAMLVDPQSSVVAERKRACDEYLLHTPIIPNKKKPPKRKISRSLHGRDGKEPDIFVYLHDSGRLLLTSKVKEVGSEYALLNFNPIKKITRRKVVRRFKGDPQTAEFDLESIINTYAKDYGVQPAIVKAIIRAESDFDPYVVSHAGARGLMQLMPSTALEMQVDDIFDPIQNIGGGVQYFARMLEIFNDDTSLALAAYNAGPGNVLRYGGIPPFKETREYVPRVMKYYDEYQNDSTPVRLKVALNEKPAPDYLPDVEVTQEIEETVSSPAGKRKPEPEQAAVVIRLKNGNTMRGKAYEKTTGAVRLELERGWVLIREDLITEII
jgi:hypothetical protein